MKICSFQVLLFQLLCVLPLAHGVASDIPDANVLKEVSSALPQFHPLEELSTAVSDFIVSTQPSDREIGVSVKPLDRRLRLAHCAEQLEATWARGSRALGRVTVRVACASPKPWRVHVQATVTLEGRVWALVRGVSRDDVLRRDMLISRQVTLGANNAAFNALGVPIDDIEPWLGYAFAQRAGAGKVLSERMLKPARLISKGEAVVIVHRSQGLELQTRGVALSDAAERQQTQVRNSSSGKIVDVIAVSQGVVEILY